MFMRELCESDWGWVWYYTLNKLYTVGMVLCTGVRLIEMDCGDHDLMDLELLLYLLIMYKLLVSDPREDDIACYLMISLHNKLSDCQ